MRGKCIGPNTLFYVIAQPLRKCTIYNHNKGFINSKGFTASEIVAIKRALEPKVKAEAKERQGTRTDLGKQLSAESAESRDIIAKFVGVSHNTLSKMEKIVEAAEQNHWESKGNNAKFSNISPDLVLAEIADLLFFQNHAPQRCGKRLFQQKNGFSPLSTRQCIF